MAERKSNDSSSDEDTDDDDELDEEEIREIGRKGIQSLGGLADASDLARNRAVHQQKHGKKQKFHHKSSDCVDARGAILKRLEEPNQTLREEPRDYEENYSVIVATTKLAPVYPPAEGDPENDIEKQQRLIRELPAYFRQVIGSSITANNDLVQWWKNRKGILPSWFAVFKTSLLIAPSSCTVERVFASLRSNFDKYQESTLEDYKSTSLQIMYNDRNRNKF